MADQENVGEESLAQSEKIKAEANEHFKTEKYDRAIELYSKVSYFARLFTSNYTVVLLFDSISIAGKDKNQGCILTRFITKLTVSGS